MADEMTRDEKVFLIGEEVASNILIIYKLKLNYSNN
jgi:pyruvate/2-oxoglutarate/acetoin dehydrogenase E1 component